MNYSHLIHERSLTTTPHRQKPIIEPPDYPVVFLTQKNKSNRVQLVFFCGGDAGFALQRLLPKVNRVQPKGFTRQCRVAILQNRNKSPLRRYKKTSRTGFNLSSLWWRCGDLNPGPPDRPRHFLHV